MIHRLGHMVGNGGCRTRMPNGIWALAVPEPFYGGLRDRISDAWAVLTGSAFAVQWPAAGDLERALGAAWVSTGGPLDNPQPKPQTDTIKAAK